MPIYNNRHHLVSMRSRTLGMVARAQGPGHQRGDLEHL